MPKIPREPPILDPPIRLAVLASGNGSTLQNLIDRIAQGDLRASIVRLIASRGGIGAIDRARAAGIEYAIARRGPKGDVGSFSDSIFEHVRAGQADLVVLAGFLSLIEIPDDYQGKVINVHPSLIPAFCGHGFHGLAVHSAAIDRGVKVSGCTVHFADSTYDTGPIILQETVPVFDDDVAESLASRVVDAERRALPKAIELYAAGRLVVAGRRVLVKDSRTNFLSNS